MHVSASRRGNAERPYARVKHTEVYRDNHTEPFSLQPSQGLLLTAQRAHPLKIELRRQRDVIGLRLDVRKAYNDLGQ